MDLMPAGTDLTPMTLAELAGRAELTQAEYADLMAELGSTMQLNVATLRGLVGRADITARRLSGSDGRIERSIAGGGTDGADPP